MDNHQNTRQEPTSVKNTQSSPVKGNEPWCSLCLCNIPLNTRVCVIYMLITPLIWKFFCREERSASLFLRSIRFLLTVGLLCGFLLCLSLLICASCVIIRSEQLAAAEGRWNNWMWFCCRSMGTLKVIVSKWESRKGM